jgi:hypothetical protein
MDMQEFVQVLENRHPQGVAVFLISGVFQAVCGEVSWTSSHMDCLIAIGDGDTYDLIRLLEGEHRSEVRVD